MPSEDYTAASTGALKLKGVNSSSKVHKHKKKKKPQPAATDIESTKADDPELTKSTSQDSQGEREGHSNADILGSDTKGVDGGDEDLSSRGKTEAERHYLERRKKRLNERLKKEGTKTHKERVEELNRYLNKLSEHHDMPKIGPG